MSEDLGLASMSSVLCAFDSLRFSTASAALAALSEPPRSATLKIGFHLAEPDSGAPLGVGYPNPAATRALLVHRFWMDAKCQSTVSGETYLSS